MKKKYMYFVLLVSVLLLNLTSFPQKNSFFQKRQKNDPQVKLKKDLIISGADAYSDGNGVWIEWQTEYEKNNMGFYVYRVNGNKKTLVKNSITPGGYFESRNEPVNGKSYSVFDPKGDYTSQYVLESLNVEGKRQIITNVIHPKYISNLRDVAGESSESLAAKLAQINPVIEQHNLALPEELSAKLDANFLEPDLNTHLWVVSQPGVKIGVKKEGIYRVTKNELQNAGFDVNAPHNQWQLYLKGNEQAIIVGNNGDYIEFYGKGIDTSEDDTQFYYLIVGATDGKRLQSVFKPSVDHELLANSYDQSFIRKDRFIFIPQVLNGNGENFFGDLIGDTPPVTLTFNLTGIDYARTNKLIKIGLQGFTIGDHRVNLILNGRNIGVATTKHFAYRKTQFEIKLAILKQGTNTLQLVSQTPGDFSLFESLEIEYSHTYLAENNQLSFFTYDNRKSVLTGFSSPNIRVFDITFPDEPKLLTGLDILENNGVYSVDLPPDQSKLMYALEDSQILPAASVTPNIPSTLSNSAHHANFVIITYKDFMSQANDWANYRTNEGYAVEVIDVENIFDEFSFGASSSEAIKTFLQFAVNNWQTPPQYVLLLGDATYDYRNYEGVGFRNFVPAKRFDTIFEETVSDDALTDFNNDGLAELAIGRIPAKTPQAVTQILNKVMAFEQSIATATDRGILFVSDLPIGFDFEAMSVRIKNQLPASIPTNMINRSQIDSRNLLIADANSGRYFINYSGHGSSTFWAASGYYARSDAAAMTNGNNLSVMTMLTCLNGYFISNLDSFSEGALFAPNGGAVATWASSGKTTADVQEVLATRFYNKLGEGNIPRLGDLVRDAKTSVIAGSDVRLSWTLLGDPLLKVR